MAHWAGDLGRAGGIYGVRFFFVISGFLITWLLLREKAQTGSVSLRNFYIRRVLRIFPVYYTFLAACWLLEASGAANSVTSSNQWWLNVFFLANYGPCKGPTGVLWSLGVEEQFYLLWPVLFVSLGLSRRRLLPIGLLLSAVVLAPFFRGLTIVMGLDGTDIISHRFSFLHHMDMLAIGCLGALLLWHYPRVLAYTGEKWMTSVTLGLVTLFLPFATRNIQGLGI
jgi:peptidoglycan/LPS O-acetylase OafA/YrhL